MGGGGAQILLFFPGTVYQVSHLAFSLYSSFSSHISVYVTFHSIYLVPGMTWYGTLFHRCPHWFNTDPDLGSKVSADPCDLDPDREAL